MVQVNTPTCMLCGQSSEVDLTQAEYLAVISRVPAQNAMPERDNDFRELIISGTHPKCWNIMFPPEEEDEDEDPNDGLTVMGVEVLRIRKENLNDYPEDTNDEVTFYENVPEDVEQ